jgi:hypothetical protein
MNLLIRGISLAALISVLLGLSGCGENNEARVDSQGVTPPGAATTSEDGLKVKYDAKSGNPYKGIGPKAQPARKTSPAPAPAKDTTSKPDSK